MASDCSVLFVCQVTPQDVFVRGEGHELELQRVRLGTNFVCTTETKKIPDKGPRDTFRYVAGHYDVRKVIVRYALPQEGEKKKQIKKTIKVVDGKFNFTVD